MMDQVIRYLKDCGFGSDQIKQLLSDKTTTKQFEGSLSKLLETHFDEKKKETMQQQEKV